LRLASSAVLLTLVAGSASAAVKWTGDFESANLRQYMKVQSVAADRAVVITNPLRQGRYAARITVRQGDNPIGASGNRTELVKASNETNGSEYYYRWSSMFPSTFPRSIKWQLFTQFHHSGMNGSPPVEFYTLNDQLRMRVGGINGKIVWTAPLSRARWYNFVLHAKWSPNSSVGFIEFWVDGKKVVPKRYMATQYSGQYNIMKIGYYRDASISQTAQIFHDSVKQSTALNDLVASDFPRLTGADDVDPNPGIPSAPASTDLKVDPNSDWDSLPTDPDGPPAYDAVDFTEEELAAGLPATDGDNASFVPAPISAEDASADTAAVGSNASLGSDVQGCSATSGASLFAPVALGVLATLRRRRSRR
jgi:uncharacterized protein (TIGR03382 family)